MRLVGSPTLVLVVASLAVVLLGGRAALHIPPEHVEAAYCAAIALETIVALIVGRVSG